MYYNKEYKEKRGKKTKERPEHLGSLFTEKVELVHVEIGCIVAGPTDDA